MTNFITQEGIVNLKNHQYIGGVYTPLDKKMNIFWYKCVEFVPETIAPNLITLTGFLCYISHIVLLFSYSRNFDEYRPNWVFFFAAFTTFIYQTFDAIDGKQARKIKLSTPLGQLFDHGLDTLLSSFVILDSLIIFRLSNDFILIALSLIIVIFGMYFAAFGEYFTGVLITSNGVIGVTETQMLVIGLQVLVGIFGYDFFPNTQLFHYCLVIGFLFFSSLMMLPNVFKSYKFAKDKVDFFLTLIPIMMIISGIIFIFCENIGERNILKAYSLSTICFCINAIKLIVSSMCKMKFSAWHLESIYLFSIGLLFRFVSMPPFTTDLILTISVALFLSKLILLIKGIINQICSELKIKVLTV